MQNKLNQNQIERIRERYHDHPLYVACKRAFGQYETQMQRLLFAPEEIFLESAIILDNLLTEPENAKKYISDLWIELKRKIRYWDRDAPQDDLDKIVGAILYVAAAVLCHHPHPFYNDELKEMMLSETKGQMKVSAKEEERFIVQLSLCAEGLDNWLMVYIESDTLLSEEILATSNRLDSTAGCNQPPLSILTNEDEPPLPSFGITTVTQAHWAEIYGRLTKAGWLIKTEVSQLEFIYIMCGVGDKRFLPIQWHGATNALADIVRRKLQVAVVDRWEVAKKIFLDKNSKPLPGTFENTKSPGEKTAKKIDDLFK